MEGDEGGGRKKQKGEESSCHGAFGSAEIIRGTGLRRTAKETRDGFGKDTAPCKGGLEAPSVSAQTPVVQSVEEIPICRSNTAIEFISPMPTMRPPAFPMAPEEVPIFHGMSPNPESWHIVLEMSFDQNGPPLTGVREGTYLPSPGAAAPLPTDVNIDGIQGDAHPYLWAGWVLRR